MAYNEELANRIREELASFSDVEEKAMFGGLCFMLRGKMCVGLMKDELMVRIDPALFTEALTKRGAKTSGFSGRPMKSIIFIEPEGTNTNKDLKYWMDLAIEYNPKAKVSKKKTAAKKSTQKK